MSTWFYYDNKGQKQGPVRGRELKQLARQGMITLETDMEQLLQKREDDFKKICSPGTKYSGKYQFGQNTGNVDVVFGDGTTTAKDGIVGTITFHVSSARMPFSFTVAVTTVEKAPPYPVTGKLDTTPSRGEGVANRDTLNFMSFILPRRIALHFTDKIELSVYNPESPENNVTIPLDLSDVR